MAREIVDPMGSPMPGADVTVTALDTHRVAARGMTDPYGYFVAVLPPGRYSLMAAAEGLQPHRETVEVGPSGSAPAERVWLQPLPGAPTAHARRLVVRSAAHRDPLHRQARRDGARPRPLRALRGGIQVAQDMSQSRVQVRIDASSITTGNTTRDNHLRSGDFLDVERFPHIDFVSSRFAYRGGSKWTLQGSLTMHGVSRSVALDTTYLGTVNGGYGEELRCAALATAELHREDYTLNWRSMLARGIAVVGPTVQLELDVQAMYRTHDTPTPPE